MRNVLKWIGIFLGGLLALTVVALVLIYLVTEERMNKVYTISVETVPITTELSSKEHQYPLVVIEFCRECHGPNLAGLVLEDDPMVGRIVTPNLTAGKGGVGVRYTSDEDWVRTLRHGVGQDGKSLIVMPSNVFYHLSDTDLGYIISYMKDLHPVDNELPETIIGPMGRIFILQEPVILPASIIEHSAARPAAPKPAVTVEYGQYLTVVCKDCHGQDFSGGEQVGAGLNITPGGELATWTDEDFIRTMRTGVTPDGETLDSEMMPTRITGLFSDADLKAIWLFLQSLPPVETVEIPQT